MPRSTRPSLTIIALLLAAAACAAPAASGGGGASQGEQTPASAAPTAAPSEADAPPTAGTDLRACEIVTAADVEAAAGLEPGTVEQAESEMTPTSLSPGHSSCRYQGEDWGGVFVELTPEDGANLYDAARGAYDDASDREITGADGAFFSADAGRGFFWKGSVTVMLQVGFLTDGGDYDAIITALGQAALDRVD